MKRARKVKFEDLAQLQPSEHPPEPPRPKTRRAILDAAGRAERFVDFYDDDTETMTAFGNPPVAPEGVEVGHQFDTKSSKFISPDKGAPKTGSRGGRQKPAGANPAKPILD